MFAFNCKINVVYQAAILPLWYIQKIGQRRMGIFRLAFVKKSAKTLPHLRLGERITELQLFLGLSDECDDEVKRALTQQLMGLLGGCVKNCSWHSMGIIM
jgi:hypothetical protein